MKSDDKQKGYYGLKNVWKKNNNRITTRMSTRSFGVNGRP